MRLALLLNAAQAALQCFGLLGGANMRKCVAEMIWYDIFMVFYELIRVTFILHYSFS